MSLGGWWDQWVHVYQENSVTLATLETYRFPRARLTKELFAKPISKITPSDVQEAQNRIHRSRRTVEMTKTALQMCLERAVTDGMIRKNPVKGATLPALSTKRKAKALTFEDDAVLIPKLTVPCRMVNGRPDINDQKSQTIRDAHYFIRMTGVRGSEALNLE